MTKITLDEVNKVYEAIIALPAPSPVFDNITWVESAGMPYGGIYNSAQEIFGNVFVRINEDWKNFKFTPSEFLVTDEAIGVTGNYTGISTATGKPLDARVLHLWKKVEGRLLFEQIADSALFHDAMK